MGLRSVVSIAGEGRNVIKILGEYKRMKETDIRNPKVLDEYVRMVAEETARTHSLSADTFYLVFLDREHRFYKTEAE